MRIYCKRDCQERVSRALAGDTPEEVRKRSRDNQPITELRQRSGVPAFLTQSFTRLTMLTRNKMRNWEQLKARSRH